MFGGSRIKCNDGDFTILKQDIEDNLDLVATDVIPKVADYAVNGYWCGLMAFPMDGMPIIGNLSKVGLDGIWMLCGFGPHGMMEGPGAAQYIADCLVDGNGEDESALCVHPLRTGCVEQIER